MRSPSTFHTYTKPIPPIYLQLQQARTQERLNTFPASFLAFFLAFQALTLRGKAAKLLGSNPLASLRNLRVLGRGGSLCGVCSKNCPILGFWANRERTAGAGRQNGSKPRPKCRQKVKCRKIYIFRQHLTIWEHLECGGLSFVCFRQFFCFGAYLKTKRG